MGHGMSRAQCLCSLTERRLPNVMLVAHRKLQHWRSPLHISSIKGRIVDSEVPRPLNQEHATLSIIHVQPTTFSSYLLAYYQRQIDRLPMILDSYGVV